MAFGIYVHIPYCLQICRYCDFTKYRHDKIMPPAQYAELVRREIRSRAGDVPVREIDTVYFGGGTPSLFEPAIILSILEELAKTGFRIKDDAEVTIEIDPTTVDQTKLDAYRGIGFNRFSVGAQTFNSRLLNLAGRKHTADDTVALLDLLNKNQVNYSFDLLFGLPTQTLAEVKLDVATALRFTPSHLSAYCLTVPETHPMARGRASDEVQVEMIETIEAELSSAGIMRYEISNFARPGFESRHNLLYWKDQGYWGLGTASHSYFPERGDWGLRFWNAPSLKLYEAEVASTGPAFTFEGDLPESQRELLACHQALTDFCHTSLRLEEGLSANALRLKFGEHVTRKAETVLGKLGAESLIQKTESGWNLTARGRVLSNLVFERLTFLAEDLRHSGSN